MEVRNDSPSPPPPSAPVFKMDCMAGVGGASAPAAPLFSPMLVLRYIKMVLSE